MSTVTLQFDLKQLLHCVALTRRTLTDMETSLSMLNAQLEEMSRTAKPLPVAAPRYLSVIQVAEHLAISERKARQLCEAGDLPASRFGSSYRIKPDDLATYEEKSKMRFSGRKKKDYAALAEQVNTLQ